MFAWIAFLISAILIGIFDPLQAKSLEISHWSHTAPVQGTISETEGAAEFPLSPQVMDLSRPGLDDLRLVRGRDTEVGYYLWESKGRTHKVSLETRLLNRTYLPGRHGSVTVDFGGNYPKNLVKIKTTGTNYLRRVKIEACDDQERWEIIRDDAFLFRTREEGDGAFQKDTVDFAENNQRYLRITVFAGTGDTDEIKIEDVEAWQYRTTDPETAAVPLVSAEAQQKQNVTEISLDLGFRNMPLCTVKPVFSDKNFFRKVEVFGRNNLVRIIRTVVEDSPKLEKSVPVPWDRITAGTVYRFSSGAGVDESLEVKLDGAKYRYLLIKILNYDDPPLAFTGATVSRYGRKVWFAPKGSGIFTLYFGNAEAGRPEYDVGRYISRLRRENVSALTLGAVTANPAFKPVTPTIPWSERHSGIIWAALLAMLAVLGILIYRVARSTPKPQEHGNGPTTGP
ncbi:MAG: DUF3999 family protein [Pseudomonadota bacterium]